MSALSWLFVVLSVFALGVFLLRTRLGWSKAFCCALCVAACACALMLLAVWRLTPPAFRPVVQVEAMREESPSGSAGSHLWLRNVFGVTGDRFMVVSPQVRSGAWAQGGDGFRWQAEPDMSGQTDAIVLSLPAAERYSVFFLGNRQSGKVRLTYPGTGESEVIDTYRDSEGWEEVIVDIGLDGRGALDRIRWVRAVGMLGCVAASAVLCIALHRALCKRRKAARAFAQKLAQAWPARAPLNPRSWRWYSFALCALFLVPLLWIAIYARPVWDDYGYGALARHAWRQTGSLGALLRAAISVSQNDYTTWQGLFSATFLLALQPGIFGEQWYGLTTLLLSGTLVLATWLFVRTIAGKRYGGVLCWLAMFFFIQFVPGVGETFFWFPGGFTYTFFLALSLFLHSLVLRAHRAGEPAKRAAYAVGACLLAAFVGGGNLITALLTSVLLALLIGYRMIQREKRLWIPLAAFVCLAGGLAINIVAPGNAVRQSQSPGMPYFTAIYTSFPQAFMFFIDSMRVEFLLGALFALPFLFQAAERSAYSFRYPGLVTLASLCVYACQATPHLAGLSTLGPDRIKALLFFSSFLFIGGNMYYWSGWLARKGSVSGAVRALARWVAVGAAAVLVLACAVTAVRDPHTLNGASAARSLLDGSAQRFGRAMDERVKVYEDEAVKDVTVPPAPERPRVFPNEDISHDAAAWENKLLAEFYGKDSVRIEE